MTSTSLLSKRWMFVKIKDILESVSVRQWFVCAKGTNLIILVRYQRVTDR